MLDIQGIREVWLENGDTSVGSELLWALCHLGRFQEAREYAACLEPEYGELFKAVEALTGGHLDEARAAFEAAMELHGTEWGLKSAPLESEWCVFYVPLLAALGATPAKINRCAASGMNRVSSLSKTYEAMKILSEMGKAAQADSLFKNSRVGAFNNCLHNCKQTGNLVKSWEEFSASQKWCRTDFELLDVFFFLLLTWWIAPERAKEWVTFYDIAAGRLTENDMTFFASELSAIGECLRRGEYVTDEWHPLKDLLRAAPEWEKSLEALEALTSKGMSSGVGKGAVRILWALEWQECEPEQYGQPVNVLVTPVEQTMQASGRWSKGRNLSVKTLALGLKTRLGLSVQERRLSETVKKVRQWGGGWSYGFSGARTLQLLVGNPNTVKKETLEPVEVLKGEPQLQAAAVKNGCRIRLLPVNEDYAPLIVTQDGPARLRVTVFSPEHLNVLTILGPDGLIVPDSAKDRTLKVLSGLASFVTVQSELEGVEAEIPVIESDSRLRVQLTPWGDGLSVEFVVRPLGNDGLSCRPGGGGVSMFGLQKDSKGVEQRVQVKRDLNAEAAAMKDAAAACPALNEGEQMSESRWQLEDAENCLELLLQLQALGDRLIIEWPRGGSMKIRAEITPQSMLGAIQSSGQDWFALTGTVTVDKDLTLSVRQLLNLLKERKSRFIPVGEGQFIALTREFQRRLETLESLADGRTKELRVSPLAAAAVENAFDPDALVGDEKWRSLCSRLAEAQKLKPEVPRTLKAELRSYQEEGYAWLVRLAHWGGGACLADEMGLGKTLQALALLLERAHDGPALVVAPTSVCGNWIDEAARFAPTLNLLDYRTAGRERLLKSPEPFDVVLVSYGLLQNSADEFAGVRWRTIVLDEAQAVKNMATKRSAAVMELQGDFRMIMTGTPLENHLGELWNLFRFLNPGLLGSLEGFNRRFASPIAEDDLEAGKRLRKIIQPFMLRRLKEQVLEELPPRTEINLRVDLSPEERAFYEALRQNAVKEISAAGEGADGDMRFAIFAQLMKLRRCCCNVNLVSKNVGTGIASSKLEAFLSLMAELREGGHRVLVFSQFVDHLHILREALDAQGMMYQYIDGSTPPQARRDRVKAFQAGEGDCFLISLRAGGTGLNLTGADYVIHMDPWWNPAVEDQASDRAHRIGQTRPVTIYRIVARDTIEEKIVELHRAKRKLAQSLLQGGVSPAALNPEELLELIRES